MPLSDNRPVKKHNMNNMVAFFYCLALLYTFTVYLCVQPYSMNFLLSLSSSWFSKLAEFILARFAVNNSQALLKRRSQAAEAGRPVLSLTERFLMWGNEFNRSILFETQAR